MIYTKHQFGVALKTQLSKEKACSEIAKWAFQIYIDHGLEFENGLDFYVLKLIAMEEGPEFFLPQKELEILADELYRSQLIAASTSPNKAMNVWTKSAQPPTLVNAI